MKSYLIYIACLSVFVVAGMSCNNDTVTGIQILEHGYYFDGDTMRAFKELVIQEDKILSIDKSHGPTKGRRTNLAGRYVIPGLTDAHVHLAGSPKIPYVMIPPDYNAGSSLRCGVTTVIDLFFKESDCSRFRSKTNNWPGKYATVLLSGPILTAPGGHGTEYGVPTRTMTSKEEAGKIVNEVIDNGVDVIKLVYEAHSGKQAISEGVLRTIVAVAHARNVKVFAHVNVAQEAMDCIDAGVDILAHIPFDSLEEKHVSKIKESGILTIPTLSVYKSMFGGHDSAFISHALLWQTAHPLYLSGFSKGKALVAPYKSQGQFVANAIYNVAQLIENKVPVVAGTDAGNYAVFYGYSLHDELYQYVLAGMTPAEALNSATKNILSLFPERNTGVIQPGYTADLVVLDKNPLKDIRNTKGIYCVYHKGIRVSR